MIMIFWVNDVLSEYVSSGVNDHFVDVRHVPDFVHKLFLSLKDVFEIFFRHVVEHVPDSKIQIIGRSCVKVKVESFCLVDNYRVL